jgi:ABC-type multidrug transport system fused ATPase/permease subunit
MADTTFMESATEIFSVLLSNPILIVVLGIIAVAFIISLVKKVVKAAVILFIILLLAGGAIFQFANETVKDHGERILDDMQEKLDEL